MSVFGQHWVPIDDTGISIELDTHIDHFSGKDPVLFHNREAEAEFNENVFLLLTKLKQLYFGKA